MLNDLFQEIDKVKTEAQKNYKMGNIKINQSQDAFAKATASQYLIDFKNIEIDKIWLEDYFKKIIFILEKFEEEDEVLAKNLKEGFGKNNLDLEVLVKKVFSLDSNYLMILAKKLELEKEDLYFLGLELGKPVYRVYAEKLKGKIDRDNWGKGNCPVCGSPPALGYLRKEDGKRILWCQFCETEWSFMRLKCPFCSNEDQNSLRYFFTEEKSFYRVDVCDRCKKYLKTIDQRKMPDPDKLLLYRESIQTLFLDLLAKKDGYLNVFV